MKRQYAKGEKTPPRNPWTEEQRIKHARTKRQKALGSRHIVTRHKRDYWMVMTESGMRYEHRVIMEEHLGRPLLRSEHVHHIDHNGLNNDISNLEVHTAAEHNRVEFTGRPSPTKGKSMFSEWSRKYTSCVECGRTSVKHRAKGLCGTCYNRRTA